jgi:flagellar hook-associated protein 3 FlgL
LSGSLGAATWKGSIMRISTKMIYDAGSSQLNTLQGALNRTQMQLSANRRNLTPADDPIASSRARWK